jgi:hypothetical protein
MTVVMTLDGIGVRGVRHTSTGVRGTSGGIVIPSR